MSGSVKKQVKEAAKEKAELEKLSNIGDLREKEMAP